MAKLSELKALEAHMLPIVSTYILGNISMFHKPFFCPNSLSEIPFGYEIAHRVLAKGIPHAILCPRYLRLPFEPLSISSSLGMKRL